MDLVERYLNAVKFWLPRAGEQDITAELSEEIRSQIEEREAGLGRRLNEAEVAAILKQIGRPVIVANRYQPQRSLIGPVLFPIYVLVLKLAALFYVLPWAVVFVAMLFNPGFRAQHGDGMPLGTVLSFGSAVGVVAFTVASIITLVFAVLERAQVQSGFMEAWDPRKLPVIKDSNRIPRLKSIIDLGFNVMFCLWWVGLQWSQPLTGYGVGITMAPVWRYFYWGFLLLAVAHIIIASMNLRRPWWTRPRAGFQLLINLFAIGLIGWECKAHVLGGLQLRNVSPERAFAITRGINAWIEWAFPWVMVVGFLIVGWDLYRMYRVDAVRARRLAQRAAPSH